MKFSINVTLDPPQEDPTIAELNEAMKGELKEFEEWLRKGDVAMDRAPARLSAIETSSVRAYIHFAHTRRT